MAIPRHDWYLKHWLKDKGRSQQWVADHLGVQKSMISRKATGFTAYDRDDINSISALLEIEPYELLMMPDDAYQVRRLRYAVEEEGRLRLVATSPEPESLQRVADKRIDFAGPDNPRPAGGGTSRPRRQSNGH